MRQTERKVAAFGGAALLLYLALRGSWGRTSIGPISQTQTQWKRSDKAEADHRNAIDSRAAALLGIDWNTGQPTRRPNAPEAFELRSIIATLSKPPSFYTAAQRQSFRPIVADDLRDHLSAALNLPASTNARPVKEYNA